MTTKQIAVQTVAEMLAEAKAILRAAETIANENGIYFSYQDLYSEMTEDYHVDWNSSNC